MEINLSDSDSKEHVDDDIGSDGDVRPNLGSQVADSQFKSKNIFSESHHKNIPNQHLHPQAQQVQAPNFYSNSS